MAWTPTSAKRHRRSPDRGLGDRREGKGPQGSPGHHSRHRDNLMLRPRGEDHELCNTNENELGSTAAGTCCWESDAVMQAYRTAAAGTVRKLASALFGRELLAVEAAKSSAAERERMLEERAKALCQSQVCRWYRNSEIMTSQVHASGGEPRGQRRGSAAQDAEIPYTRRRSLPVSSEYSNNHPPNLAGARTAA